MISTPIHSGTWWTIARAVVCALVVIYLIAPMIIVLIISFSSAPFLTFPPPGFSLQWFRKLFGHAAWQDALLTTSPADHAAPTGIIATVLGTRGSGRDRSRPLFSRRVDRQRPADGAGGHSAGDHHCPPPCSASSAASVYTAR